MVNNLRAKLLKLSDVRTEDRKLFNIIFILITIYFTITISPKSTAQTDLGTSFVTGKPGATTMLRDYEAIGVNPANLGFNDNNRFSLGLGGINMNLQSRGMNFKNLYDTLFAKKNNNNNNNDNNNKVSSWQINQILQLFKNDGINLNSSVNLAGLSLHLGRLGGISLSMRDRVTMHLSNNNLKETAVDSLINGKNTPPISTLVNGTNANIQYLRELNLAYGFKLIHMIPKVDIYAGIGYRYIMGLGYINLTSDNNLTTVQTSINGSNYDVIKNENILNLLHVPLMSSDMFNTDGHGSAVDLGANAVLLNKITLGVSINNIGSVKWNSMQQATASNARVDTIQKHINSLEDLFNQENLFKKVPCFKTYLPAEFRLGAGIKLSRFFEAGADIAAPLNKTYGYNKQAIVSAGVQLNLFRILKLNTGISGNDYLGWNVPIGITLSAHGFYDIYIATNDILTYVNKTKNPMVSFAICAIRFNLPARKKWLSN